MGQNGNLSVSLHASISLLSEDAEMPLRGRGKDKAFRIGPEVD